MRIGKNKLKMVDGSIRKFKSEKARDNFEKMAQAVKHGFVPNKKRRR